MKLYKKIIDFLQQNNIDYEESKHEAVYTSEEAAKARNSSLNEGAKALIFFADDNPIQIVIDGDKKVDKDKFKKQFEFKKLKMVGRNDVPRISGVEPGAVAPFGNLFSNPIPIYVNRSFLDNEYMEFNAGHHEISIRMKVNDWVKVIKPVVGEFS